MRQQGFLCLIAFIVCLLVVFVTLHWTNDSYRNFNEDLRRKLLSFSESSTANSTSSLPRTNIFFLKAHKCASSTLQNILLRFGFSRNLDFVLPKVNNYIGSPIPFNASMIDGDLASLNGKYNMFTHHTRYNAEQVKAVMYDDAAFVTILRNPADVYESIFSYYKFNKTFKMSLQELLASPGMMHRIKYRFLGKIGLNQMSFDLGLPEEYFSSEENVREFVEKIDNEFDLVMISEYMEASLVLLSDLMNWSLEDVISLKLNSRTDNNRYKLTESDRALLTELSYADKQLYQHFLDKFRSRIKLYGEEKMKESVTKLINLNDQFSYRCVEGLNKKGYGHTTGYNVKASDDWACFYAARPELLFTEDVRTYQINKYKTLKKLDTFMNDINLDKSGMLKDVCS